jgi:hypothetical protein
MTLSFAQWFLAPSTLALTLGVAGLAGCGAADQSAIVNRRRIREKVS